MDSRTTKRGRELLGDQNLEESSGSEIANLKRRHVDVDESSDGGRETAGRFDLDLRFGVFDFPWSKDSLISKSEDWKFDMEDVFFTSLIGITTGKDCTELSGQFLCYDHESNVRAAAEGEGPAMEGMDWSFLLNQPLRH